MLVKQSQTRCGLLDHYLSPVLGRVPEKLLWLLSPGKKSGQDKQVIVAWWVVCPVEALLSLFLGAVFSIPPCKDAIHQSCPSWIPRWQQGGQLTAKTDTKWRQRCQASLLCLLNLWA
jgi:hypothetical protein